MATLRVTQRIDAPPARVFEVLADVPNWAEHVTGIRKVELLTDGPVGVGTRFRETRVFFKREATEEMEITEFEPGRGYVLECDSCGCHYRTSTTVVPDGTGTRVELEMQTTPVNLMAKLMSPLASILSGPLKKCIERDLEDTRAHLEAGSEVPVQT